MAQTSSLSRLEAAEEVYRRHAPQIFAYLLRHTPVYQDAEELLLDVFWVVLEKLPDLDQDEQRLAAYIQAVARHKVADYYRRHAHLQHISLEEIAETMEASEALGPEQQMLLGEQFADLQQAISRLPKLHQVILHLRFAHGLPIGEIARHLAKSENAVRMTLSRALKRLRNVTASSQER